MKITRIEGRVMKVNSYLVESADGIVVVDGMLTVSDAKQVRRELDARRRPVLGAIVTHAHPDHYAGLHEMMDGFDAPVLSTASVADAIARDDATKNAIVGPMMGAEWPAVRRFPQRIVNEGSVTLGDQRYVVRDLGASESPADSLWSLADGTVFVGDLAYNGMHAYLADGYHSSWLTTLAALHASTANDARVYPGHGEPGDRELFTTQARYIEAFVQAVHDNLRLSPEARRAAVVETMRRHLPTEDLLFLMELSVDPIAAKLESQ